MGGYIGATAVGLVTTAADVSGDANIEGNLTVKGTTVTIDSANAQTVDLGDNDKIRMGDGDDLQIYHDATNSHISNATGDLTLDVAADIILDADGGTIKFKDDGTHIANIGNSSSDLVIESKVQDKDIKFLGDDGGTGVTALTLDMSDAGTAQFNHDVELVQSNFINWKHQAGGTLRANIHANSGDNLIFGTGSSGTERMRIKDNGTIQFKGDLETVNSTMVMRFRDASENFKAGLQAVSSAGQMVGNSAVGDFAIRSQSNMLFSTDGNTERMRLDTSGNLHIGRTSTGATGNGHTIRGGDSAVFSRDASGETVQICRRNDQGDLLQFRRNGGICGEIVNTGSSSVAYNTSSDYRLKENVTDVTDGITRVKQLAPKRFNFIADGTDTKVEGFLAHEAQTVVPEAVTGTKDQVLVWNEDDELPDGVSLGDNKLDDSGNTIPKYQGIDQAKLVPLLTAALQEAIAKIETLETKVAALEGK